MSLWLTADELIELTGYKQRKKQRTALAKMNISFRSRLDGFPLVSRDCTKSAESLTKAHRRREPNFTAIGRV